MYDRYDSSKGRYVTYDYRPKGDKFSRGLADLPRTYKQIHHTNTGHTYYRRTRTDEVQELTMSTFRKMLPREYENGFEKRAFYLDDTKHDLLAFMPVTLEPPGVPLRFDVTRQHKGRRVWFVCFHCDRRVGKLYRVKGQHWLFRRWGCRTCLGLTYPSQAGHKTQARDWAITRGLVRAGWREEDEAYERQHRRMTRLFGEMDRLLESMSRR